MKKVVFGLLISIVTMTILFIACQKEEVRKTTYSSKIKENQFNKDVPNYIRTFFMRDYGDIIGVFDSEKGFSLLYDTEENDLSDMMVESGSYLISWDLDVAILISDDIEEVKIFHMNNNTVNMTLDQLFSTVTSAMAPIKRLGYKRSDYYVNGMMLDNDKKHIVGNPKPYVPNQEEDIVPVHCGCIGKDDPDPNNCDSGGANSTGCNIGFNIGGSIDGVGSIGMGAGCASTCAAGSYSCCTMDNEFTYDE